MGQRMSQIESIVMQKVTPNTISVVETHLNLLRPC
jgi:hypothetical protein